MLELIINIALHDRRKSLMQMSLSRIFPCLFGGRYWRGESGRKIGCLVLATTKGERR
jgi:hypothetical protein